MKSESRRNRIIALAAAGPMITLTTLATMTHAADASVAHQRPRTASTGCSGQTTANAQWVCAVYETVLERAPDPAGQAKWEAALTKGESRREVAHAIVTSAEYRSDFIQADYQAYLNRNADSAGMNALQRLFDNGGTDEQVDSVILGSAEYYSKNGATAASLVNALYEDILGRPADSGGQTKWQAALAKGQSRRSVAFSIDCSQESRTDSVEFFYGTFFNRSADSAGSKYWVDQLNAGATDEDVISALLGSTEFYKDVTGSG